MAQRQLWRDIVYREEREGGETRPGAPVSHQITTTTDQTRYVILCIYPGPGNVVQLEGWDTLCIWTPDIPTVHIDILSLFSFIPVFETGKFHQGFLVLFPHLNLATIVLT